MSTAHNRDTRPKIGAWIRGWRKVASWTQKDVAAKMDTTQATVSRWEKDLDLPSLETLTRLFTLYKDAGVNPSAPPTPLATGGARTCPVVGSIGPGGAIFHEPRPSETVALPAMLSDEPLAAYRVETDALPPLGLGWLVYATNRRGGVRPETHNALSLVHSLLHGAFLGFLRPVRGGQYILERLAGAAPLYLDDVAWAEKVVMLLPIA